MKKRIIILSLVISIGVTVGYIIYKINTVLNKEIPDTEDDNEDYKESNIEEFDTTTISEGAEDQNTLERSKMRKELIKLRRFRTSYINSLDDDKLMLLYNTIFN